MKTIRMYRRPKFGTFIALTAIAAALYSISRNSELELTPMDLDISDAMDEEESPEM